jgi:hypothetical protein
VARDRGYKDGLAFVRGVASGADEVSFDEWRKALLRAAEVIRDLSVVIDSGTLISIHDPNG